MVEVDDEQNEVTREATLPAEVREDRDGMGHVMVFDQKLRRCPEPGRPRLRAPIVSEPWSRGYRRRGPPAKEPEPLAWDEESLRWPRRPGTTLSARF
jgi:hypothetical protein